MTAIPLSSTVSPRTAPLNRSKILDSAGGRAIQAEDVLSLTPDELRELYQPNQVLYVYHNRIDATGDKPGTERQVFEAAEETLRDSSIWSRRLANANATNILITADHGFLFQDDGARRRLLPVDADRRATTIKVTNRRYVLGRGLKEDPAFKSFTSAQLGLQSDLDVQIPKSIHRLRLRRRGLTIRARWRDASGNRRPRAGDQQEAQERHPPGQRRGAARVGQDHHRPVGGQAVPVRAGEREGPGPHASVRDSTSARR